MQSLIWDSLVFEPIAEDSDINPLEDEMIYSY